MDAPRPEEIVQRHLIQGAAELGWRPVDRAEMNKLRSAHLGESVVEPLLVDALVALNPGLTRDQAVYAAERVRRITDPVEFSRVLREGLNVKFPDQPTVDVRLVDPGEPSRNDFVVTDEFVLRTGGTREPRLDTVFLVNGLPLMVVENKAPTEPLAKAAQDFAGYWEDAPELTVFTAIAGICNGSKFRVGASGAAGLSGYAAWKDTYPHPAPAEAGEMETVLLGVLDPHTLIDLAANYLVFETRDGVARKKLARYQQYRAADKIVRRVTEDVHDRGIVWHTQGSGKSLTMIFAARKLLAAGLDNPTVFIVVDRTDLDEQINDTLIACDFDGVTRAESRAGLKRMLAGDRRGVIVTTVQKFSDEVGALDRENVIVLVDEAHRSHERDLGTWMRNALSNAKLFAFTGTPVESSDHSTRKAFSPVLEGGVHEDYLDSYRIGEAIDDGATVPVIYEPRLVGWAVASEDVDEAFEHEFAGLSDEEQEALREDAAKLAVVAKTPERVAVVAEDVGRYLRERTAPQGFKAQLVAVDRAACVLYAEALADHLSADEYAVVFSRNKHDTKQHRRWYASAQLARVGAAVNAADTEVGELADDEMIVGETEIGALALSVAEKQAVKKLIKRFLDPGDPLRLLIVNNMLLTGFDAPIEQVMFLDRGLSGHNLLQAIARTNRPYAGKDRGVVVDYWGVFSQLEKALKDFNAGDVERAAIRVDELRERFPEAIMEALAVVAGFPQQKTESQQAAWLLARLDPGSERAEKFEERYRVAQSIYETLSPDPGLAEHLDSYDQLTKIHAQWRVAQHKDVFDPAEHRAKTAALVQQAVDIQSITEESARFLIGSELLSQLSEDKELTPAEKAAQIESALTHEIVARGEHDPLMRSLAERLRRLRERKQEADEVSMELLAQYEQLAIEYEKEQKAAEEMGLSDRGHALLTLAREHLPEQDEQLLAAKAREIDQRLAEVADFDGWQEREDVLAGVRKLFIKELASDAATRPLATGGFIDEAVQSVTARAARS